jgi:hypothetical protein
MQTKENSMSLIWSDPTQINSNNLVQVTEELILSCMMFILFNSYRKHGLGDTTFLFFIYLFFIVIIIIN